MQMPSCWRCHVVLHVYSMYSKTFFFSPFGTRIISCHHNTPLGAHTQLERCPDEDFSTYPDLSFLSPRERFYLEPCISVRQWRTTATNRATHRTSDTPDTLPPEFSDWSSSQRRRSMDRRRSVTNGNHGTHPVSDMPDTFPDMSGLSSSERRRIEHRAYVCGRSAIWQVEFEVVARLSRRLVIFI